MNGVVGGFEKLGFEEFVNIWSCTSREYLQNFGLENVDFQSNFLDGIKMYHSPLPVMEITPPVSFRTQDELRTGNVNRYRFHMDNHPFPNKESLVDFLVSQLLENKEIFIYSINCISKYNFMHYSPTKEWVLRAKILDWSTILNRTDFSFLKIKKDFTPRKNIPTFTM